MIVAEIRTVLYSKDESQLYPEQYRCIRNVLKRMFFYGFALRTIHIELDRATNPT
jgi:hypothetical protein